MDHLTTSPRAQVKGDYWHSQTCDSVPPLRYKLPLRFTESIRESELRSAYRCPSMERGFMVYSSISPQNFATEFPRFFITISINLHARITKRCALKTHYEMTPIGAALSLSVLPRSEIDPFPFFSKPSTQSKKEVDMVEQSVWRGQPKQDTGRQESGIRGGLWDWVRIDRDGAGPEVGAGQIVTRLSPGQISSLFDGRLTGEVQGTATS
ncbi:hypothetical protein EGW08_004127 [Elysia chlorotica]|uniref:Uncharacterized protein n=1 Tax=Elysia chlorotica TaxID=188477 RepID=A0A433U2M2_ELYCH|nr:hypothetical protein EGW08_004127 [Elysia chlorotica]